MRTVARPGTLLEKLGINSWSEYVRVVVSALMNGETGLP